MQLSLKQKMIYNRHQEKLPKKLPDEDKEDSISIQVFKWALLEPSMEDNILAFKLSPLLKP